jgi:hypothetical protein
VPEEQRLRRHDHPVPPRRREDPSKRGEERAIGCSERRPRLLPTKHQQLMAQNEQLDVLGELVAAAANKQLQQSREHEICEGKKHPPNLPELAVTNTEHPNLVLKPLTTRRHSSPLNKAPTPLSTRRSLGRSPTKAEDDKPEIAGSIPVRSIEKERQGRPITVEACEFPNAQATFTVSREAACVSVCPRSRRAAPSPARGGR